MTKIQKILGEIVKKSPKSQENSANYWLSSSEWTELLGTLESDKRYSVFENHLQYLGNGGSQVSIFYLADWLVRRSLNIGVDDAVSELEDYLNTSEVTVHQTMLLANVLLDDSCNGFKFCNGVKIIEGSEIPNSRVSKSISTTKFGLALPLPRIGAILIRGYQQKIVHVPNTINETKAPIERDIIESINNDLFDTKACLVLGRSGDYDIQSIAVGTVAPDSAPFIQSVSGWSLQPQRRSNLAPELIKFDVSRANKILKKFKDLDTDFKTQLKLSIERLNGYYSGSSWVDKEIDLRVCLESIFLSDNDQNELRKTLSIRAALFLGTNLEEKKQIQATMKTAYDVTSKSIHTGKVSFNKKKDKEVPIAAKYAKQAIIKLIEKGPINWRKLELSPN